MSTNYVRGRAIEWKLVNQHKANKATVTGRTAGSHSAIDVFAIYEDTKTIVFQQVKRSKGGHFEKVKPPFLNGTYYVRFEAMEWKDREGFVK